MLLGQILVAAGVVDADQVSAALRQQVVYGGRLGTNVIELGYADADQIARALSRQHQVPPALRRHLERHDPAVLEMVPAELAAQTHAFPLAFSLAGGARRLVVCMRDPDDGRALDAIRHHAAIDAVPCVAAELLVYALLERFYGVARPRRMAHAQHGHATPLPTGHSGPIRLPRNLDDDSVDIDFDADEPSDAMASLQLVELDDESVVRDLSQYHSSSRTVTISEIASNILAAASAETGADIAAAATDAAQRAMAAAAASSPARAPTEPAWIAAEPEPEPEPTPDPEPTPAAASDPGFAGAAFDLGAALGAIMAAGRREDVTDAVLSYMANEFGGGLVLLAKDGLALGAKGFGGLFDDTSVESVVLPLNMPSAFQACHDSATEFRGQPPDAGRAIQDRFFKLFPLDGPPSDIVIVPVVIRGRVVCLYYAHGPGGGRMSDDAVEGLIALSRAAGEAFVQLIRDAKRR